MTETVKKYFVIKPEEKPKKWLFNLYEDKSGGEFLREMRDAKQIYPRTEYNQTDSSMCVVCCLISPCANHFIGNVVGCVDPLCAQNQKATLKALDISGKVFDTMQAVKDKCPQTDGTFDWVITNDDGEPETIQMDKMVDANWQL